MVPQNIYPAQVEQHFLRDLTNVCKVVFEAMNFCSIIVQTINIG